VAELDYASTARQAKVAMNRSREAVRKFAEDTSYKAKQTATYFGDRRLKDVWEDARKFCVSHPGQTIGTALAIGFLVGLRIRR
jgi:ElaB/YqjD/DUF883 family membrane-anchored ribosome-binding protein